MARIDSERFFTSPPSSFRSKNRLRLVLLTSGARREITWNCKSKKFHFQIFLVQSVSDHRLWCEASWPWSWNSLPIFSVCEMKPHIHGLCSHKNLVTYHRHNSYLFLFFLAPQPFTAVYGLKTSSLTFDVSPIIFSPIFQGTEVH